MLLADEAALSELQCTNVQAVQCPHCGADRDRVVDSRPVDGSRAIRRRRQCLNCGDRFTTMERLIEEFPLWVRKRSGLREPFDKEKIIRGVAAAVKNRGVSIEAIDELASRVELEMRSIGNEVSSEKIGLAVLDELRALDDVGWVRFASVYKEFESLEDFRRELSLLEEPQQQTAGRMPKPGRLERLEKVNPPKDPRKP